MRKIPRDKRAMPLQYKVNMGDGVQRRKPVRRKLEVKYINYENAANKITKDTFKAMNDERAKKRRIRIAAEEEKRATLEGQIERQYPPNARLAQFAEGIRHRIKAAKHMFIRSGHQSFEQG